MGFLALSFPDVERPADVSDPVILHGWGPARFRIVPAAEIRLIAGRAFAQDAMRNAHAAAHCNALLLGYVSLRNKVVVVRLRDGSLTD